MRRKATLGLTLAALWVVLAAVPTLQARPTTQSQFRFVYRTQRRTTIFRASCQLCHETRRGGKRLNKYGEDLRRAGKYGKYQFKGYRAIEKRDSDKDGFTNGEEIAADKLPGSRVSRPKRAKKASVAAEEKAKTDEAKKQSSGEAEAEGEEEKQDTQPPSQ